MVPEGPRLELYCVVMFELDAPAEPWLKHRWIPVAAIQNESACRTRLNELLARFALERGGMMIPLRRCGLQMNCFAEASWLV